MGLLASPPLPKDVIPPSRNYVAVASTAPEAGPLSVQMPLTRRFLERERAAFFDTQVTGDRNVWNALRSACEIIRAGGDSSLETAAAIIQASGARCPSGRLWVEGKDIADQEARRSGVIPRRATTPLRGGAWDERGNHYFVPAWALTDPLGVVDDRDDFPSLPGDGHTLERHCDAKGKARAAAEEPDVPEGQCIRVPVRLATGGRDVLCRIRRDDCVEVLVRRIRQTCQVCSLAAEGSERLLIGL